MPDWIDNQRMIPKEINWMKKSKLFLEIKKKILMEQTNKLTTKHILIELMRIFYRFVKKLKINKNLSKLLNKIRFIMSIIDLELENI